MNEPLERLARKIGLADAGNECLRLRFALACVSRVRHLLEDPDAATCLDALEQYLAGGLDAARFDGFRTMAATTANGHRGSNSLDGSAHAAVSASYAVANALAGKALEAAAYAAYAAVYAYGGYAVGDAEAFEPEFAWQVNALRALLPSPTVRAV